MRRHDNATIGRARFSPAACLSTADAPSLHRRLTSIGSRAQLHRRPSPASLHVPPPSSRSAGLRYRPPHLVYLRLRWLCPPSVPAFAATGRASSRRGPTTAFSRQRRLASSTISQYSRHATPCIHQTALPHASTGLRSHGLLHLSESPTPDMATWGGGVRGSASGVTGSVPPNTLAARAVSSDGEAVRWGEEVVAWAAKGCPQATLMRTTREPQLNGAEWMEP
uniref:Uncharacterized protein n=1 Tax=Oryza sativa subsp. japonica TaxID=39947 RepID=Q6H7Z7_ORYSJ|nr:hypothetical protein [Oryza sativa Japonica Group]